MGLLQSNGVRFPFYSQDCSQLPVISFPRDMEVHFWPLWELTNMCLYIHIDAYMQIKCMCVYEWDPCFNGMSGHYSCLIFGVYEIQQRSNLRHSWMSKKFTALKSIQSTGWCLYRIPSEFVNKVAQSWALHCTVIWTTGKRGSRWLNTEKTKETGEITLPTSLLPSCVHWAENSHGEKGVDSCCVLACQFAVGEKCRENISRGSWFQAAVT